MKEAVLENQRDPAVIATPGGYNLNVALFALAEALEEIEARLDRLENRK
ncbi:MAG: hypothetical protein WAL80_21520 [Xanthobacteraceae bacterium]